MPRTALSFALFIALTPPAMAAETHLQLGESATVMVAPDELSASLRVEAATATAAETQKRVNEAMRMATVLAKDAAGISVSTGGYGVWHNQQPGTDLWQGSQSLTLSSRDGAALLKLTGVLQQKGLAISGLNWHLAAETQRNAHRDATQKALSTLRTRVDEAAAALDMTFSRFASVRLDSAGPRAIPMMAPMAAPSALAAAPPPVAVTEDIPVTATVEADAVLAPR